MDVETRPLSTRRRAERPQLASGQGQGDLSPVAHTRVREVSRNKGSVSLSGVNGVVPLSSCSSFHAGDSSGVQGVVISCGCCPNWFVDHSERRRLSAVCYSSCCSARTAPTRRMTEVSLGKIPTTLHRRVISLLSLSSGFVEAILDQRVLGNSAQAVTSCSWRPRHFRGNR